MTSNSGITALVVAAGSGSRAGGGLPKQYRPVARKSVLAHAVDALANHPAIDTVQVVIGDGQESLYRQAIADRALPPPVTGGATRRESVRAGLETVRDARVLIHDAARPFVPGAVVDRLVVALDTHAGAVPVLPLVDTIARSGDALGDTLDRSALVRVQTPQAFVTADILDAHRRWPDGREATDDAQMLRAAGKRVAMVEGDSGLEKLTYEADFLAAERRLETGLITRIGQGFDVHAFGGDGPVWLCGVAIPHARGLAGHSDADVALHALTDALLGAAALGDIGDHFPPSDPQWRGAASRLFLEHAVGLIAARGGIIDNVDLTLICETPRIGPYRDSMRASLAGLLRLPAARISVKATTTERLGFTGRAEGIAAQAVATIRMKDFE
jgi:2-C-methyl-D-erythritol 4-phosphate cytidylyltransferase / 2-C-methyl-D-erythritol 2,4-cyclodiphosphate synthase